MTTQQQIGEQRTNGRSFPGSIRRQGVERQTAKVPSNLFLYAALGSVGLSAYFQIQGNRNKSLFIGQWAPTFLAFGVYNKIVQILEHD